MTAREKHLQEIRETEEALATAKDIHKNDLKKGLKRLKQELMEFDRWHRQAERHREEARHA